MELVQLSVLRKSLRDFLDRVADGEQIVVVQRGLPVAKLVPLTNDEIVKILPDARAIQKTTGPKPKGVSQ